MFNSTVSLSIGRRFLKRFEKHRRPLLMVALTVFFVVGTPSVYASNGSIQGQIVTANGFAVPYIEVQLYAFNVDQSGEWTLAQYLSANTDGSYSFEGLAADTYRVGVYDPFDELAINLYEFYESGSDVEDATDIVVGSGETVGGIDIALDITLLTFVGECGGHHVYERVNGQGYYVEDFNGLGEIIVGTSGKDGLVGTPEGDLILGLDGDDQVWAGSGNDIICGGSGNDTLYGGPSLDYLDGGDGNDMLDGGDSDDNLFGGLGSDTLNGGSGFDILIGGRHNDVLDGGMHSDALFGYAGDDILLGGSWGDRLNGGSGNDMLSGDSGDDKLFGSRGNDQLDGGQGNDTCTDTFGTNQESNCESGTVRAAVVSLLEMLTTGEDAAPDFAAIRAELLSSGEFFQITDQMFIPILAQ